MTQAKTKDILALIEIEHRQIEQLFAKVEQAEKIEIYNYFNQIYKALNLHTRTEEIVFYPAMQEYQETRKYIQEAEEEHEEANLLLEKIKNLKPTDSEFNVKINKLKEAVQHHVEEEESEIFSAVRKCMKEEQLVKLGQEFLRVKEKIAADVETAMTI
ncbi:MULTISPECIES: hemerythrin domain-containing protein [Nostocales]|uniref:Hemerythrin n=3 Tax=Nostocales TaxID=1161 RepID=A0A0C1NC49_9CYAN|nr:hemerythrin domain-containing protein [Tolypothrix bouteillei]KAF3890311.1 hemerythrin domain-containing protein [Tolypothrix bouteillei VB521301]